jgi:hypothetical protein
MNKISFSAPSVGGTIVSGLSTTSGALFVLLDGTRGMTGALVPVTSGSLSIGTEAKAFGSGVFNTPVAISGISVASIASEWSIRNNTNTGYVSCTAQQHITTSSGAALSGSMCRFVASGDFRFAAGASPSSEAYDVCVWRPSAGMIRIGTSDHNANGGIEAASGIFTSGGITIVGTHGSGVVIGVSNDGAITITGPFIYV